MVSPPPVKQLIVIAHPDPDSFCASVAHSWQNRAQAHRQICELRNLYADGFDPVLKINEQPGKPEYAPLAETLAECERIRKLDVLVFVYPVWFGSPPAMLKGYLERVIGSGISFNGGEQHPKPLANVRLVQISTSASNEPWLAEKGIPGALHTIFDRYIAEVFGAKLAYRLHLGSITDGMGRHKAGVELARVDELVDRVCAEANADRWDNDREGGGRRN